MFGFGSFDDVFTKATDWSSGLTGRTAPKGFSSSIGKIGGEYGGILNKLLGGFSSGGSGMMPGVPRKSVNDLSHLFESVPWKGSQRANMMKRMGDNKEQLMSQTLGSSVLSGEPQAASRRDIMTGGTPEIEPIQSSSLSGLEGEISNLVQQPAKIAADMWSGGNPAQPMQSSKDLMSTATDLFDFGGVGEVGDKVSAELGRTMKKFKKMWKKWF